MPLFNTPVDLAKNELQNPRLQNLASNPGTPVTGQFYFNTTSGKMRVYNGSTWDEFGTGGGTVTSFSSGNLSPLFTTNVATPSTTPALTFTLTNAGQNAVLAGPSTGGAGAPTYRSLVQADIPNTIALDYWASPSGSVNMGSQKIISLADPTNAQDAATKAYVDAVAQGMTPKAYARVMTTTNITLTGGAPNTVDGISIAANDRILVTGQSAAAQNGIYTVQTLGTGSNGTWVRASDSDTWAELVSAFLWVSEGTSNADTFWYCTADAGGTLGTTAVNFLNFQAANALTYTNGVQKVSSTVSLLLNGGANSGLATSGSGVAVSLATNSALSLTGGLAVASTIAGNGLAFSAGVLSIGATDTSISVAADAISVALATSSGLEVSSGLKIRPDTVTAGTLAITLTANGAGVKYNTTSFTESAEALTLAAGVAGTGLTLTSGVLSVTGYTVVAGSTVARKVVASTTFATGSYSQVITHNLNTKDVQVYVYNTTNDNWEITEVDHTSVNTVTVSGVNNSGSTINANVVIVG